MPSELDKAMYGVTGQYYGVDPLLLRAVSQVESQEKDGATSPKGATGRMQIIPPTAAGLGVSDTRDPMQSIPGAARYLLQGLNATGSPEDAIRYYHGGPDRAQWGPKTQAYLGKVEAAYQLLRQQSSDTGPAPSPQSGPLVIGDSIADGVRTAGNLPGTTRAGADPRAVLATVRDMPADQVNGRDVVLSGGASNDPTQTALVAQQIGLLQGKGAKSVSLLGVGDRADLVKAGVNGALSATADQTGARFVPLDPAGLSPDRVHPADYKPIASSITAPQRPADTDMAATWGVAPAGAQAPSAAPARPSDDDLAKAWGAAPPAAPNDNTPTVTVTAPKVPQAAPAAAPTAPAIAASAPDYTGWDQPTPQARAAMNYSTLAPASGNALTSYQNLSNALAPAPNTTYGNVLPFARDNTTGAIRPALPQAWRDLAQGAVDLAYGPALGTVTPQATGALSVIAGPRSPAAGTGKAIAAAGANPLAAPTQAVLPTPNPLESPAVVPNAPNFVPPGANVPVLDRITQLIQADNDVAANRPAFIPPAATQPPNPLSAPTARVVPPAVRPNPLAQEAEVAPTLTPAAVPKPAPSPTAGMTPAEEAVYNAIPEKLPPAPMLPPVTQNAAEARADQLIQHFAAKKGAPPAQDFVPGYTPTLAQITNDPGIATLERGVQSVNPGPFGLLAEKNQQAIRSYVGKLTGAPEDVAALENARETSTAAMRNAAFENKTPVDAAPVDDLINAVLTGQEGKREAVSKTLSNVQKSLHVGNDPEAPLETDPEMLYGVRKHINDLLSPTAQRDNPELQAAARQLTQVKGELDNVIESGAPGFKAYTAEYANQSQPIDALKYLQSANLTDAAGNVVLSKVDSTIKNIERQQKMPGVQKASAVSDDQLAALNTLRTTLRAQQFSSTAGKALGSNTFQNLATNSRVGSATGNPLVSLGLAGAGSLAGGPLGMIAGAGINMGAHRVLENAERNVSQAMIERLLNLQGKGVAALGGGPKP